MDKIAVFLMISAGLGFLSIKSLNNRGSHGFYRFFAFELILILILLNVDVWFSNPFSVNQVVSWILLSVSFYLAVHGFILLKRVGKPTGVPDNSSNLGFENTTRLVTVGIYRFIRHPLYASLAFGTCGVFFKDPSLFGGGLTFLSLVFLTMTARTEERENIVRFGEEYKNYMKNTRMFVPYLFVL